MFISNAFKEIKGKEIVLSMDYDCSRILEKLLKNTTDLQIRFFTKQLLGSFQTLFTHQFSSHVCQTIFNLSAQVIERKVLFY